MTRRAALIWPKSYRYSLCGCVIAFLKSSLPRKVIPVPRLPISPCISGYALAGETACINFAVPFFCVLCTGRCFEYQAASSFTKTKDNNNNKNLVTYAHQYYHHHHYRLTVLICTLSRRSTLQRQFILCPAALTDSIADPVGRAMSTASLL